MSARPNIGSNSPDMSGELARPDFLNQPAKLRKKDRELQEQLKKDAAARGVVPSKDSRRRDFLERSIKENRRHMRGADADVKIVLKQRNKFLRDELKRLSG